ncbi:FMN-binding protein [Spirochaeta isovalerica]|uniref:Major membrane immunogen (Membrane-anchored lipoprotein) n=1 Tax=Spirochaeta isovalerica TaxID=150 RepID=A0A841RBZ9_9SPIO|nr:FMN-binding protein [Spirochaeta isovalerica]MBB6480419.1 major membrane immunogen (membrane-anchored lipoprotein) [Spirochaeta isovalerica]
MKKITLVLLVFSVLLFSCSKEEKPAAETKAVAEMPSYKDGVYFAQEDEFSGSGWKYNVTLEVKDGKIVKAVWNGANINAGKDKVSVSKDGEYGMVEKGGASAPWFEQAAAAEVYLLKTQDPASVNYVDEDGHTDSFSGASIHVIEFFSLAEEALAAGPVGYGPYKDGVYHAEQPAFDHGYKYFADITVISGYIVAINLDALAEDGGTNKAQRSMDGEYGMVENGGASAPWFEQAAAIENNFLATQDINMPDAVSGATIGLDPFYELVNEALANARK